jgi:hypothetical protein
MCVEFEYDVILHVNHLKNVINGAVLINSARSASLSYRCRPRLKMNISVKLDWR